MCLFKNVLCLSSAVCFVSYYLIPFHERKPRSSIFFLLPNSLYFVLFFLALSMGQKFSQLLLMLTLNLKKTSQLNYHLLSLLSRVKGCGSLDVPFQSLFPSPGSLPHVGCVQACCGFLLSLLVLNRFFFTSFIFYHTIAYDICILFCDHIQNNYIRLLFRIIAFKACLKGGKGKAGEAGI